MLTSVLIDSREPEEIKKLDFGVPSIIMALDAGDAIATCGDGNTLVIERKTPGDLLGSIKDGRLFRQCHKMRELSEFCYLVVVGKLYWTADNKVQVGPRKTRWNWDSVQGALLTVQEMGVGIVYGADFKTCVERLARRDRDGLTIHQRRQSEPMTPNEAFLASLPGLGAVKAKKLLGYGPACWGLHWLTDNRPEHAEHNGGIAGVSQNQKDRIRNVLGLGEQEFMSVRVWEAKDE